MNDLYYILYWQIKNNDEKKKNQRDLTHLSLDVDNPNSLVRCVVVSNL